MPRIPARRLAALLLGIALVLPTHVARADAWQTFTKMVTTNDIIALRDTVWLATGEAGLLRYIRSLDRFESVTRTPGGLASNNLSVMTFDRSGRLWVGTQGAGLSRLSADGRTWDLVNGFDGLQSDSITVLRADGDTVWVGTTRGLDLWDGKQVAGSVPDAGTDSPFRNDFISGIVVMGDTLFVSTGDGIWSARLSQSLRPWSETDTGIPVRKVDGLISNGSRIFALAGTNVYVRNVTDGTWSMNSVGGVVDKVRDDYGVALADSPNGLFYWTGTGWNNFTGNGAWGSGSGAQFAECAADPSGSLFNTHAQTLYEQVGNSTTWLVHTPAGPVSNDINNVYYDGTYVWLGSDAGVGRFDGTTWRNFTRKGSALQDTTFIDPSSAMMIQKDLSGRIWFANWGTAVERVDPRTDPMHVDHAFIVPPIPPAGDIAAAPSWGWSSTVDTWGDLYVGGDTRARGVLEPNGIAVYDTTASLVTTWTTRNAGLGSNQVRGLAVDSRRQIWAGFAGAGVSWAPLDSVDADTTAGNDHLRLPVFTAINALLNQDIIGVNAHGDSIWVLTSSDLRRLRASTKDLSSIYEIPGGPAPRAGVHPLDVASDGTVWVGSVAGVRRYLPRGGFVDYRTDNSPLADNEVRSLFVEKPGGAVWIGTAAGLNRFDPHWQPPAPPAIPALTLKLWPNPASLNGLGLNLRMSANTPSFHGEVVDLNGRIVRKFGVTGTGGVVWDGRDGDGAWAKPGVYFVHAVGGGHEATTRVVVLR